MWCTVLWTVYQFLMATPVGSLLALNKRKVVESVGASEDCGRLSLTA